MKKLIAMAVAMVLAATVQAQSPKGYDYYEYPIYGSFTGTAATITFNQAEMGLLDNLMLRCNSTNSTAYTFKLVGNAGADTNTISGLAATVYNTTNSALLASTVKPLIFRNGDQLIISAASTPTSFTNWFVLYWKNLQR